MTTFYTKEDYAIAYTEVLGMIKYFTSESLDKIPKDVIEMYEQNKSENYEFEFDRSKSFDNQDISKLAKILIANIFTDYIATEEEREYLNYRDKQELNKIEEEKRNKYNPDDIFSNRRTKALDENTFQNDDMQEIPIQQTDLTVIKGNEGLLQKIFEIIKRIFKK